MRSKNHREVALVFREYARKIHERARPEDPNFIRLSVACGKVCFLFQLLPSSSLNCWHHRPASISYAADLPPRLNNGTNTTTTPSSPSPPPVPTPRNPSTQPTRAGVPSSSPNNATSSAASRLWALAPAPMEIYSRDSGGRLCGRCCCILRAGFWSRW
jgi:hypothetical protein